MIDEIGNIALNSSASTVEELLNVSHEDGTVNDYIVAKISKIGEKLSLRRIEVINKSDDEVFGNYIHNEGKIAVLILMHGGNDSVARDIAMQAAAMKPEFLNKEEIAQERIERERTVFKEQAINEGKAPDIAEKMVEGRLNKFYKEVCLLNQMFIKDDSINIETYAKNNGGVVKKMIRYEVGEGLEKRNDDFAQEVMNQIQ